jgi:hypothetical protein
MVACSLIYHCILDSIVYTTPGPITMDYVEPVQVNWLAESMLKLKNKRMGKCTLRYCIQKLYFIYALYLSVL